MKKYFLAVTAIVLFSLANVMAGGTYSNVPEGPSQALATADYGGVDRSTVSFSSANVLCFTGVGSVVGFVLSSGIASNDFVLFRDTGSLIANAVNGGNPGVAGDDYRVSDEFIRVYTSTSSNMSGSNTAVDGSDKLGTTYMFPKPIRVYRGLTAKVSTNLYNILTVLWNKLDK